MNKLSSNYDLKTHSAGISMRDFIYFIITIYNIISFNIQLYYWSPALTALYENW